MKQMKLAKVAFAVSMVSLLASCGISKVVDNADQIKYDVSPNPLEMHGGKVDVTINTTFPAKYFMKSAIVAFTPVLVYDGGEMAYDSIVLQGEKVEGNYEVIPFEEGKTVAYSSSISYDKAMRISELKLRAVASKGTKRFPLPDVKLADGVVSTADMVEVNPKTIIMKDAFQRIIPDTYEADIHYSINQGNVKSSELREDDIKALEEKIKTASGDERIEVKGAKISAYASPDGPEDLNTEVSDKRSKTAQKYLSKLLKKAKIADAEAEEFLSAISTPEDWEGFKTVLGNSSIQDKDLILRVLSIHSDPEVREQEIKNIAEAFQELKKEVLPELRRSRLVVNVNNIGYSDEELLDLVKRNPDTLTAEELLYAASLLTDLSAKVSAYKKAKENFPQNVKASNNLGTALVAQGNLEEAKAAFEAAKEMEESDIVNNNLAVIDLLQGNKAEAEAVFVAAKGAGSDVDYNLGIIKIMDGDYAGAVSLFGDACSNNSALAKLLGGSAADAATTLDCVDKANGLTDYLKAVLAARADNAEGVYSNLKNAISKDGSLKETAKTDIEFRKYNTEGSFTSIVE